MTDRPILFSAPMITALLEGRKTQTRRLAWRECPKCPGIPTCRVCKGVGRLPTIWQKATPGDRIWVKENFSIHYGGRNFGEDDLYCYKATDPYEAGPWKSSIHMPRIMSRLTLIITDVRLQPLNDITDEDAIAEGIVPHPGGHGDWWVPGVDHPMKAFPYLSRPTPREMYAALWDVINGSGEWLGNPDVIAITARVENRNIDQEAA